MARKWTFEEAMDDVWAALEEVRTLDELVGALEYGLRIFAGKVDVDGPCPTPRKRSAQADRVAEVLATGEAITSKALAAQLGVGREWARQLLYDACMAGQAIKVGDKRSTYYVGVKRCESEAWPIPVE